MNNIEVIVSNSFGNVMKCPCGKMHINIPGVSLHFDENQFKTFYSMISQAAISTFGVGNFSEMRFN